MRYLIIAAVLLTSVGYSQDKYAPIPGAPVEACEFDDALADTPIQFLAGADDVPYQFACGHNRPAGVCVGSKIKPGIVFSAGATQDGWTCVTGGDSTSGWVPSDRVAAVPDEPTIPLQAWIGWWRKVVPVKGVKNDRLLITAGVRPGTLHISGRAYWYGIAGNVHVGGINTDHVVTVGPYLHAVEGPDLSGCVLDLKYDELQQTFSAFDNAQCGGMNVRFLRTWQKFTPSAADKKCAAHLPL